MTLRVIGAVMALTTMTTSAAHAETDIPDSVLTAADQAGVSPADLAGAVSTTGLEPHEYLCMADHVLCPPQPRGRTMRVKLTYYVDSGVTASGGHTYAGSTACSYNFAFGTRFRFPDGETFTCNDRGRLGSSGWLDLYSRADVARKYGPYATVEIIP